MFTICKQTTSRSFTVFCHYLDSNQIYKWFPIALYWFAILSLVVCLAARYFCEFGQFLHLNRLFLYCSPIVWSVWKPKKLQPSTPIDSFIYLHWVLTYYVILYFNIFCIEASHCRSVHKCHRTEKWQRNPSTKTKLYKGVFTLSIIVDTFGSVQNPIDFDADTDVWCE